jgi:glycosyltransferase involved in cell wall biosynthesis
MIVKDEAHLGVRVFETLSGNFDAVCIVDTGSTDNTVKLYTDYLVEQKIPFHIVQSDWKWFDGSRTEAIESAEQWLKDKKGIWYLLFWDADDVLLSGNRIKQADTPFRIKRNDLKEDRYMIDLVNSNITYERTFLVRVDQKIRWCYYCPVHEFVDVRLEGTKFTSDKIRGCYIDSRREGARSKDPQKYYKDAKIFEERLKTMKVGDKFYDRYMYYRAQSYKDAGMPELGEKCYLERAREAKRGDEYDYLAFLRAAEIRIDRLRSLGDAEYLILLKNITTINDKTKLGCRGLLLDDATLRILIEANQTRNQRYEAVVKICEHYRCATLFNIGYALGSHTLSLPKHKDCIFVDHNDHSYKLLECTAVCSYYIGNYKESKRLCEEILIIQGVPEDVKLRAEKNLAFALDRMNPKKAVVENKENVGEEKELTLKEKLRNKIKKKGRK